MVDSPSSQCGLRQGRHFEQTKANTSHRPATRAGNACGRRCARQQRSLGPRRISRRTGRAGKRSRRQRREPGDTAPEAAVAGLSGYGQAGSPESRGSFGSHRHGNFRRRAHTYAAARARKQAGGKGHRPHCAHPGRLLPAGRGPKRVNCRSNWRRPNTCCLDWPANGLTSRGSAAASEREVPAKHR